MTSTFRSAARRFTRLFALLLFAGFMLGALHKQQWILFTLLVVIGCLHIRRRFLHNKSNAICELTGFILTTILGTSCELWGTYNEYWTYHDIPSYQLVPAWIPVAWGFTYFAFHLFESCVFQLTTRRRHSLMAIAFTSLILPTVGEYIPIYMGVWTYHWPYQLMGVPLLASLGIWAVHLVVFVTMNKLNQKYHFNTTTYTLLT